MYHGGKTKEPVITSRRAFFLFPHTTKKNLPKNDVGDGLSHYTVPLYHSTSKKKLPETKKHQIKKNRICNP
jgi:hypothetical protein